MSKIPALSHAELLAMLDYDPETGDFTWRHRHDMRPQWNARYAKKRAGYIRTATGGGKYWSVRIHDWPFHAHRLAWFYVTGSWPVALIDHIDMDGTNNAWSNLREATRAQNAANTGLNRTNTTGFKGVSPCKSGKFRATIRVGGRQVWLGRFATAVEASAAYEKAIRARSGDYARLS